MNPQSALEIVPEENEHSAIRLLVTLHKLYITVKFPCTFTFALTFGIDLCYLDKDTVSSKKIYTPSKG